MAPGAPARGSGGASEIKFMADSDKTLKLLIELGVVGQKDAEAARDLLKETGNKTNDLSDETKKLGDAAHESGVKMGESRREIREMGNELGRVIGVSGVGRAMLGGMGLAAFAAAASLDFLKSTYEVLQDAAKGPINIEVKADDAAKIHALADAYSAFADGLRKTREAQNSPQAMAEHDIAQLQTKLKLLQDILQAEEREVLANLAVHKDQMSPQAYARTEQEVKDAFAGRESTAAFDERQEEIDRKTREADDLDKKSAEEKARGLHVADRGVLGTAIENGQAAEEALKKIKESLEWIHRLQKGMDGGDVAEYMGSFGKLQEFADIVRFYQVSGAGNMTGNQLRAMYELQAAQAQSQIHTATEAQSQQKAGQEATAKSAEDLGEAEKLRQQVKDLQVQLEAEKQTKAVTTALGAAGSILGQEHAAEGNNTPMGVRDAAAAHIAAANELAQISSLLAKGGLPMEAVKALAQAVVDLRNEDARIVKLLTQAGFNSR